MNDRSDAWRAPMIVVGGVPCSGKTFAVQGLIKSISGAAIADLYDTDAHRLVRNLRAARVVTMDRDAAAARRFLEYSAVVVPFRRELERRASGVRCLLVEAVSPVDAFLSDAAALTIRLQPPVSVIEDRLMLRHESTRRDAVRLQSIAMKCCALVPMPAKVQIVSDFECAFVDIASAIHKLCCD